MGNLLFKDIDGVKFLCSGCKQSREKNGKPQWDKLVEDRAAWFARPKTFVKALEEGLIAPVENPLPQRTIAECHFCHKYAEIRTPKYQLCSTCGHNLQFHGEKCSIGGEEPCNNDAHYFDTNESRFVCNSCNKAKKTTICHHIAFMNPKFVPLPSVWFVLTLYHITKKKVRINARHSLTTTMTQDK